jgi:hypothetical protein
MQNRLKPRKIPQQPCSHRTREEILEAAARLLKASPSGRGLDEPHRAEDGNQYRDPLQVLSEQGFDSR